MDDERAKEEEGWRTFIDEDAFEVILLSNEHKDENHDPDGQAGAGAVVHRLVAVGHLERSRVFSVTAAVAILLCAIVY